MARPTKTENATKIMTLDSVVGSAARIKAAVAELNAALDEADTLHVRTDMKLDAVYEPKEPYDGRGFRAQQKIISKRVIVKSIRFEIS